MALTRRSPTNDFPGIPFATHSLGHGLSLADGTAQAKNLKREGGQVSCLASADPEPTIMISPKLLKFFLAGFVNTMFGLAVYSAAILFHLPVWGALLVSTLAGIAFNFVTMGGFVFRDLSAQRIPRFVAAYAFLLILNTWLIGITMRYFAIDKIPAQALLCMPMALVSWAQLNYWVFHEKLR